MNTTEITADIKKQLETKLKLPLVLVQRVPAVARNTYPHAIVFFSSEQIETAGTLGYTKKDFSGLLNVVVFTNTTGGDFSKTELQLYSLADKIVSQISDPGDGLTTYQPQKVEFNIEDDDGKVSSVTVNFLINHC